MKKRSEPPPQPAPSPGPINRILLGAALLGAVVAVWQAPYGVVALLLDGPIVLAVLLAGLGLGLGTLRLLGLARMSLAFQLVTGCVVGIGILALLVLGGAAAGVLNRVVWWMIVSVLAAAGVLLAHGLTRRDAAQSADSSPDWYRLLWLAAIPFVVMLALTVTMPVGGLWESEAHGYDARSYHLLAPREWHEAGRLAYLPHNAYSNMPFLMEMLYLLAMVLTGGHLESIYVAQLLHAAMACLTVGAVWLACRPFSPLAATVSAVAAATCPWLVFLGCLPYNEWGLGAGFAVGIAALIRAIAKPTERSWGLAALSGLALGLSAGCKYTGVVMAAIPVGLGWVYISWIRPGRRLDPLLVAGVALLAFCPWMIKNVIHTGNPFFPLAYSVFGGRGWTDELADRWERAHRPEERHASPGARITRLGNEILTSHHFGPLAIAAPVLAAYGLYRRRRHPHAIGVIGGVLLLQVGIWLTATHLLGRFAVPMVAPMAILVGLAAAGMARAERAGLAALLAGVSLFNVVWLADTYAWHIKKVGPTHGVLGSDIAEKWPIHKVTEPGDRILYVGLATAFYVQRDFTYNVVFSRNPLAEAIAEKTPEQVVRWLSDQGYTHVLVHWSEVKRLRGSYGYEKEITPENLRRLVSAGLIVDADQKGAAGALDERTLYKVPRAPR